MTAAAAMMMTAVARMYSRGHRHSTLVQEMKGRNAGIEVLAAVSCGGLLGYLPRSDIGSSWWMVILVYRCVLLCAAGIYFVNSLLSTTMLLSVVLCSVVC